LPLPSGAGIANNQHMSDSPAVNWEQLDMIADGYAPDFVEIYREFETDLPRILGEARDALNSGDAALAARAAHQAKGSAANFGFFGFSGVMARIEVEAKAGNIDGLKSDIETAAQLFRQSIAMVKNERGI
jgi:HPt (histidine-containing phosphotransfer) domain-containing protein